MGRGHGSARLVKTLRISFVSQVGVNFVISCFICIFYPVLFVHSISVPTVFIPVWLDFIVFSWFAFLFCTCHDDKIKEINQSIIIWLIKVNITIHQPYHNIDVECGGFTVGYVIHLWYLLSCWFFWTIYKYLDAFKSEMPQVVFCDVGGRKLFHNVNTMAADALACQGGFWQGCDYGLFDPWASYRICKNADCACAGNAGNTFPGTDSKGNRWLAIPTCITPCSSHTCRDACRDRWPAVAAIMVPDILDACVTHNFRIW